MYSHLLPPAFTHTHAHLYPVSHTYTHRHTVSPPSPSLTWEPPTWKSDEPQTLAQTWKSLSWSHNCSSLVNDRLCNLIPHTHIYMHTHTHTQNNPPPPSPHSLRVFWRSHFPLPPLAYCSNPNCQLLLPNYCARREMIAIGGLTHPSINTFCNAQTSVCKWMLPVHRKENR